MFYKSMETKEFHAFQKKHLLQQNKTRSVEKKIIIFIETNTNAIKNTHNIAVGSTSKHGETINNKTKNNDSDKSLAFIKPRVDVPELDDSSGEWRNFWQLPTAENSSSAPSTPFHRTTKNMFGTDHFEQRHSPQINGKSSSPHCIQTNNSNTVENAQKKQEQDNENIHIAAHSNDSNDNCREEKIAPNEENFSDSCIEVEVGFFPSNWSELLSDTIRKLSINDSSANAHTAVGTDVLIELCNETAEQDEYRTSTGENNDGQCRRFPLFAAPSTSTAHSSITSTSADRTITGKALQIHNLEEINGKMIGQRFKETICCNCMPI